LLLAAGVQVRERTEELIIMAGAVPVGCEREQNLLCPEPSQLRSGPARADQLRMYTGIRGPHPNFRRLHPTVEGTADMPVNTEAVVVPGAVPVGIALPRQEVLQLQVKVLPEGTTLLVPRREAPEAVVQVEPEEPIVGPRAGLVVRRRHPVLPAAAAYIMPVAVTGGLDMVLDQ